MGRATLVIILSLGVLLAGCGGDEQAQQEEPEERTTVVERTVVKTVEAPESARTTEEQATSAVSEEPPEETLALQYQYINADNYEAAYDLFTEESKQLVSLEQYRAFFENAGYYDITDHTFLSAETEGDTATIVTDYAVSSGITGEEQYQRTQQLVREDGSWRVMMRDEQVGIFAGAGGEPAPAPPPEEAADSAVIIRVTGDPGIQFQGSIGNIDSTRSVEGTTPAEFPVDVDQGFLSGDAVSANAQNMIGGGTLIVQIVNNGEVVKESTTSAEYGVAQVSWLPGTE